MECDLEKKMVLGRVYSHRRNKGNRQMQVKKNFLFFSFAFTKGIVGKFRL